MVVAVAAATMVVESDPDLRNEAHAFLRNLLRSLT